MAIETKTNGTHAAAAAPGGIDSFWASTAADHAVFPPLKNDITTDVAILGGGFTGLSAARELVTKGVSCTLLEAHRIGWGASGRNGGMAVLRYKRSWSDLATTFGNEAARHLYGWIHEAIDTLERNVGDFGIQCDFARYGHLTAAPHPRSLDRLKRDRLWLKSEVSDTSISIHDAVETQHLTGSARYAGSYLDPRSAGLHPLNYCRGLAQGISAAGVAIHENTPASGIRLDNNGVILHTENGDVRARKLIVCTSAYASDFDLALDLQQRIVPLSVAILATEEIASDVRQDILREGHLVTDTKNLVNYYRIVDNRMLFGGRGDLSGKEKTENHKRLISQMEETFPQLRGIGIGHKWSGRIGLSLDNFPHLGKIGENVVFATAYGGRGVALSHLLGTYAARLAAGETITLGPMTEAKFQSIPFLKLRLPIMHAGAIYYRTKDAFGL